jgi:hypothetical protein
MFGRQLQTILAVEEIFAAGLPQIDFVSRHPSVASDKLPIAVADDQSARLQRMQDRSVGIPVNDRLPFIEMRNKQR